MKSFNVVSAYTIPLFSKKIILIYRCILNYIKSICAHINSSTSHFDRCEKFPGKDESIKNIILDTRIGNERIGIYEVSKLLKFREKIKGRMLFRILKNGNIDGLKILDDKDESREKRREFRNRILYLFFIYYFQTFVRGWNAFRIKYKRCGIWQTVLHCWDKYQGKPWWKT